MIIDSNIKKNNLYLTRVIGETGIHKVRVVNILEKTVVVEILDMNNKLALVRKKESSTTIK